MSAALKAGLIYFVIVFAVAFVLGTLRVLFIVPAIGELWAVALEVPLVLALSWIVCGWVLKRHPVDPHLSPRLLMGCCAFALLMAAELAVAVLGFGRSVAQHFAAFGSVSAQLGLAAQVVFAAFPLIQGRVGAATRV